MPPMKRISMQNIFVSNAPRHVFNVLVSWRWRHRVAFEATSHVDGVLIVVVVVVVNELLNGFLFHDAVDLFESLPEGLVKICRGIAGGWVR